MLVSDSGKVVASNRTGDEVGAEPQGDAAGVVSDAVAGGETVERDRRTSTVFVAAPINVGEGQDWAVVVEIPESAILADAHTLRTTILIGALVTLLLAGARDAARRPATSWPARRPAPSDGGDRRRRR